MKRKILTLYIGVIHQKNETDDFVDIKFITLSRDEANKQLAEVKDYAIKVLRLKCVINTENYVLCKSIDENNFLESFVVERIVIIKGDNNE